MKRKNTLILSMIILLTGCTKTVSLDEYNSLETKYNLVINEIDRASKNVESLQNEIDVLTSKNEKLIQISNEFEEYKNKMTPFEELESLEKEADRIIQENEEKAAKEREEKESEQAAELAARIITMPRSSSDYIDKSYEDAVTELRNAGFANVKSTGLKDLIVAFFHNDGDVKEIYIDGVVTSFMAGDTYDKDIRIEVKYHSY